MPSPSFSVRIGSTGKAELRNDFAEIKKDGVATQQEIAAAGEAAAKRVVSAYEKANADLQNADRRRAAAADKIAAMAPQTPLQASLLGNAQPAGGISDKSARDSAAAMRDLLKQEELLEARTHALRMAYDPLYVAQTRYNQSTQRANELLAAGRIGTDLHARVLQQEEAALRRSKEALEGHGASLGLNRMQAITAQSAVLRFTDSIIAGRSPLTAFALEAHKGAEILSLDDGGMAGGLAKVRALINPVTIGVAATAAVVATGVVAWYQYSKAMGELEAISRGAGAQVGLTGRQLEESAVTASKAGSMTISAAEEIEKGYLKVARSGDVLTELTSITKDYAAATGQDLKTAQADLVQTFGDVIDGAENLREKYGLLTEAQQEEIEKLVAEGRTDEAQRKLVEALQNAYHGAARQAGGFAVALDRLASAASNAFHWIGQLMEQEARAGQYGYLAQYLTAPGGGSKGPDPATIAANARRAIAGNLVDNYQGDTRDDLSKSLGKIKDALRNGNIQDPDEIRRLGEVAGAYQRAIETWMPKQEKARRLAEADVEVAKAKTKAEKEAAVAARERIRLAGEVITKTDAETQANAKGEAAADRMRGKHDRHGEALRRQAEAMEVNARESLNLANAYLELGHSSIVAEARRKAMTDATRKGIDVEAQIRREVALEIAEEAVRGAKAVAHLRDETAIRGEVNDRVAAGTLAAADMNQAMADEAALRPLLMAKAVAHGEALKTLIRIIAEYTKTLGEAHAEEGRSAALQGTDAATRQAEDILKLMAFAGDPQRRAREAARLAAEHEADDKHMQGPERETFLRSRSDLVDAQQADARAEFAARTKNDQADNLAMVRLELSLAAANDNVRQAEIDKLRTILELKKQGIDPTSEEGKRILANVAALDVETAHLRRLQGEYAEARQFGESFIDDVFSVSKMKNFGDYAKKILDDLVSELEKLALINPLKNWLLGENNPTGGGVFGALKSLLGGGSGGGWGEGDWESFSTLFDSIPGFASGTDGAPGGLALVGEKGVELVNLPRGSRVTPADQTRRLLAANDGGMGALHLHIDASIYAPNADAAGLAQLEANQRRMIDELPNRVIDIVANAKQRRLL